MLTAWSALKAGGPAVANLWTRGRKIVYRLDDLEMRISAMEDRLKSQPPDACSFCGEPAMRMYYAGPPIMGQNPIARIEDWRCASCGNEERRARLFDR